MKKLLSIGILCLALIAGLFIVAGSYEAKAADDGNDTFQRATKLTSKKAVQGVISESGDKDWYVYTVEEDGPFFFKLTNLSEHSGAWNLKIYSSDIAELNAYSNKPDNKTLSSKLNSFKKGYKVYICVTDGYIWGQVPSSVGDEYSLQIIKGTKEYYGFELEGKWEKEDNDNKQQANKLEKATPVYGMINLEADKDIYKYKVVGDGSFTIRLENQTEWQAQWYMSVYDADYNLIKEYHNAENQFTLKSDLMQMNVGDCVFITIKSVTGLGSKPGVKIIYLLSVEDNSKVMKDNGSKDNTSKNEKVKKLTAPYSILAGTNVVVGKAEAGATVYLKLGKKTISAVADEDGIYRIVTGELAAGKSVKMWQKVGEKTSKKVTVKVASEN